MQILSIIQSIFLRNERFSLVSVGALMVIMVMGMGIVSLTSLNDKAMKGYLLTKLENEKQILVTDGEVTDMMALRARSLSIIEAATVDMVKPGSADIVYVTPVSVVAAR